MIRVVNDWNRCCGLWFSAPTVNSFKNRLDKLLKEERWNNPESCAVARCLVNSATSTILISAFLRCAHLEPLITANAHSLITANSEKRAITLSKCCVYKSVHIFKTRTLLDFRLQSLECTLMRNGLLRMRANEKLPTENTRSPSAPLTYVLLIRGY